MSNPFFCKEFLYAMVPFCGCLNFGYTQGWWSPLQDIIKNFTRDNNGIDENKFKIQYDTWFPAISSLFALFGPFFFNFLNYHFNRKNTFMILNLINLCLWLTFIPFWVHGTHFRRGYPWFIINRALIGFITGAFSSISPVMLVELAPENAKNVYGTFNQFGIVLGIVILDFIGEATKNNVHIGMCLCAVATSILGAVGSLFIPNTAEPSKLSKDSNKDDPELAKEKPWNRKYIKGLIIGCLMMFFQQFCGVNAFLSNLKGIFDAAGLDAGGFVANIQAAVATFAQNVAIFISFFFLERLGIYVFWALSSILIAVCVFIYGFQIRFFRSASWLPVVLLFIYMLGFGAAYGPVPWFVVQALFPPHVIPLASSIVACSNWILAFLMVFLFPFLRDGFGSLDCKNDDNRDFKDFDECRLNFGISGCCFLFGVITVIGFVFGLIFVPRKGQTNNDIKVAELDEA